MRRVDLLKNLYADQGNSVDNKSGVPNGYNMGALLLPLKPGGMGSYNPAILNLVKLDADAKMGRALEGSSALTLVVTNAQADQIVSLVGSASLSLVKNDAAMSAGVEAVASGAMAFAADASLGGIIPVSASGAMAVTPDVDMSAQAFMEAEAGGATPLSPEGLSAELLDNQDIETGYSLRESLRLMVASMAGKVSGGGTSTITIRSVTDGSNRIVATVDSNGNRTSVTYDVGDE